MDHSLKSEEYLLAQKLEEDCHTHYSGKQFWSKSVLQQIITSDYVRHLLTSGNKQNANYDEIVDTHMRILAVLTQLGKSSDLWKIIEAGVSDKNLPLRKVNLRGDISYSICLKDSPRTALGCFAHWDKSHRELFLSKQYQFIPAFLDMKDGKAIKNESFDSTVLLPFLEDEHKTHGGYGDIHKVKIPSDCHGFDGVLKSIITKDYFAVKHLPADKSRSAELDEEFWQEVEALQRYSGLVHEHLVTLLMTWKIGDQYCLLFPWADSDLSSYWKTLSNAPKTDSVDHEFVLWISRQIVGLAGALATIHSVGDHGGIRKYGRHGDIKPENILFYPSSQDQRGILVIADFGLTAFNTTGSRSNQPNRSIGNTPGYRPPECDISGGTISQAFDIWTFGCLLSEMVCWTLGGPGKRNDFQMKRTTLWITNVNTPIFFDVMINDQDKSDMNKMKQGFSRYVPCLGRKQLKQREPKHAIMAKPQSEYVIMVKPEVSEVIAELHNLPQCTRYFHDLLDLIEDRMIVVETPNHKRVRSPALLVELEKLQRKVSDADSYSLEPCPSKRSTKRFPPVPADLTFQAYKTIETHNPRLKTRTDGTRP